MSPGDLTRADILGFVTGGHEGTTCTTLFLEPHLLMFLEQLIATMVGHP